MHARLKYALFLALALTQTVFETRSALGADPLSDESCLEVSKAGTPIRVSGRLSAYFNSFDVSVTVDPQAGTVSTFSTWFLDERQTFEVTSGMLTRYEVLTSAANTYFPSDFRVRSGKSGPITSDGPFMAAIHEMANTIELVQQAHIRGLNPFESATLECARLIVGEGRRMGEDSEQEYMRAAEGSRADHSIDVSVH